MGSQLVVSNPYQPFRPIWEVPTNPTWGTPQVCMILIGYGIVNVGLKKKKRYHPQGLGVTGFDYTSQVVSRKNSHPSTAMATGDTCSFSKHPFLRPNVLKISGVYPP